MLTEISQAIEVDCLFIFESEYDFQAQKARDLVF